MKKILGMAILLMVATWGHAIPAKKGQWRTITLADGSQVRAMRCGDEHLHFMRDAEGRAYRPSGQAGLYQEADLEALETVARQRRAAAEARRAMRRVPRKAEGTYGNYRGRKKGIIILVEFSDTKFQEAHTQAFYHRVANEENFTYTEGGANFVGSVADYFRSQSLGAFELSFDVVGPVTLSNKVSHYGGNDMSGDDLRVGAFASEAIQAAAAYVNYADYDWEGDGEVDQVYLLYAGAGEANGGDDDTIWPHEWSLTGARYSGSGGSGALRINGVRIDTYACGPELQPQETSWWGVTSWMADGIGTICHEFSHCLGYPDFYDTSYGAPGMGNWDVMDQGSYNEDGFRPSNYTSYERWVAGWQVPVELNADTTITQMQPLADGGDAYILYNDGHKDEYYLLENRQCKGWDAAIPGSGMLILHVDYDQLAWDRNEVNTSASHQRMSWVPADNEYQNFIYEGYTYYTDEGMATDPYPYQTNNGFGNSTSPAATLFNANTDGTYKLNKEVSGITQLADGSMSFGFKVTSSVKEGPADGYYFRETFDNCGGTGGNDGLWKGNIASSTFAPDNTGWLTGPSYGASLCARFGNSVIYGQATTPVFTLDGTATLTFLAAPWGDSEATLGIRASGFSITGPASFSLAPGQWTTCTTTLTGNGTGRVSFTLTSGRFFLDEVQVPVTASGVAEVRVAPSRRQGIHSVFGRYMGIDSASLPHGVYIINGRKVVK